MLMMRAILLLDPSISRIFSTMRSSVWLPPRPDGSVSCIRPATWSA